MAGRLPYRPIYFIASYPRSGNTWVRAFLFALLQEAGHIKTAEEGLTRIDAFLPWDISDRFVLPVIGKSPTEVPIEELAASREQIHAFIAKNYPGPPLVKTHALRGQFHGHSTFNTEVTRGAVYLVRNPLDVASSLAKHLDIAIDRAINLMGRHGYYAPAHDNIAPEPWGSWSLNVRSWTDKKSRTILILRHEDLVADPHRYFGEMVRHMGLKTPPRMVSKAIESASLDRLQTLEQSGQFHNPSKASKQFFGGGVSRGYKEKLTPEQAGRILQRHAAQMQRFGYLTKDVLDYAGADKKAVIASSTLARPKPEADEATTT